jgi:hypothetical protein
MALGERLAVVGGGAIACGVAAVAASIYLLVALEILKLRLSRFRELVGLGVPVSAPEEVDAGVATELETGTFPAVDPETGEFAAVDTREYESLQREE